MTILLIGEECMKVGPSSRVIIARTCDVVLANPQCEIGRLTSVRIPKRFFETEKAEKLSLYLHQLEIDPIFSERKTGSTS